MTPIEYVNNAMAHYHSTGFYSPFSKQMTVLHEGKYYTSKEFAKLYPISVIEVRQKVDEKKRNPDSRMHFMRH